jgi:hypothetical protein
MYSEHVYKIGQQFDEQPAETLVKVVDFTLASIQQQFHTVPNILKEWQELGTDAPTMWGMKRYGYKHIREHSQRLSSLIRYQREHRGEQAAEDVIDTMLEVPGLNTVKAGFVAQILGFHVGCIDSVNAELYNIKVGSFKIAPNQTARTRSAKIAAYVTLCNRLGGPAFLWDTWCEFIGQKYGQFGGADEVSEQHWDSIRL